VICPNCGENNSANFRYCGMCGTSLEMRRPAGAPRTVSSEPPRAPQYDAAQNEVLADRTVAQTTVHSTANAVRESPGGGGPSFLGLNQPFTDGHGNGSAHSSSPNESFSGLDSFFEPEDSGVSARGIFLLLVLLVALGAGGYWTYAHYNGAKPTTTDSQTATQTSPADQTPATPPASTGTDATSTAAPANSSSTPSPATTGAPANSAPTQPPAAAIPVESAKSTPPPRVETQPEPKAESNKIESKTTEPNKAEPNSQPTSGQSRAKPARENPRAQKIARAEAKPAPRPSPAVVPVSGDKGDAQYKRGEAYLYGRGMPENCAEAIKNLKDASAMQNAKARSTFGTMYATGHCVPRDLPTSYSWFAQALRVDPNNQILEKDLTAVWNQMTPPERQIVARNK
jgi:hypothetical protein